MKKKIILSLIALVTTVAGVAAMSAYEAHVINVTAHIENALSVLPREIMFGTVFPQEKLYESLTIEMSKSFSFEDRVDDIEYVIKQKPKPLVSENATWCHDNFPGFEFYPRNWEAYLELCYVPLCPYLSKMPDNEPANDQGLRPFHSMDAMAYGRLAKSEFDTVDFWTIDLDVPCFEGQCAQDWTHQGWELPRELESEVFGCDLWIEITGISETRYSSECDPGTVYPCENTGLPGICAEGTKTCDQSGYWGECIGPEPNTEVCDDDLDNDCDGLVDCEDADCLEYPACNPGPTSECSPEATESCSTGLLGVCTSGIQTCDLSGFWGTCEQINQPTQEICDDYLDNDCDGLTDYDDADCTYSEPVSTDTGWKSPTSYGSVYTQWLSPQNAFTNDGTYTYLASGADNYKEDYYNFSPNVSDGATIDGIEVRVDGYNYGTATDLGISVYNGTSWATEKETALPSPPGWVPTVGSSSDLWGLSWTASTANSIKVYINSLTIGGSYIGVDLLEVKVHYTE